MVHIPNGLFRQNFNGTGTGTGTKLASIIVHGSFHTVTWTVPVPAPILCHYIGLGPVPVQPLSEWAIILLPPATKLRQGNVFTPVCHSAPHPSLGRTPTPWADTPGQRPPWADTTSGRYASYRSILVLICFAWTLTCRFLSAIIFAFLSESFWSAPVSVTICIFLVLFNSSRQCNNSYVCCELKMTSSASNNGRASVNNVSQNLKCKGARSLKFRPKYLKLESSKCKRTHINMTCAININTFRLRVLSV